jgi:thiol-disulfide isomerase/thioredoxin
MKALLFWAMLSAACWCAAEAQPRTPQRPSPQSSPQEQEELESALSEAGASPADYVRAIEKHLQKYPNSPRKDELERAAARSSIEAKDNARIILHGERVLAREPDDLQMLDRVMGALLESDSKENVARALTYARRYEQVVRKMPAQNGLTQRGVGHAIAAQARATGYLGHFEEALGLAKQSFDAWPSAEAAREVARWLQKLGKPAEAAAALAEAFAMPNSRTTDEERAHDRGQMGELYRQAHGSETGLGDLVLQAYDQNVALIEMGDSRLRTLDPNSGLTDPMEFTLSGTDGKKLNLATLKSKVVVFDFWATWCVPCRVQHPLYEKVKQQFHGNPDVAFLSVDTDTNRALVGPFLDEMKWQGGSYFEDGLSRILKIASIPTTVITDRHGRVFSRMNGFKPERFVEMLTARIKDALAN